MDSVADSRKDCKDWPHVAVYVCTTQPEPGHIDRFVVITDMIGDPLGDPIINVHVDPSGEAQIETPANAKEVALVAMYAEPSASTP
jgi:hypothetical protein